MIELSLHYQPLFKLSVNHSFYSQGNSRDLKLVPAADTSRLAKKLGFILKESGGDYFLLYEYDKLEGFLHELERPFPLKFTFLLYANNPYFINFTDLPVENKNELLYFNNVFDNDNQSLLHKQSFVSLNDKYPVVPFIEINAEGKDKEIELKDGFGNSVLKNRISGNDKLVISNQKLPVGKYELWESGQFQRSFILYSDLPAIKPVGVADIFFSGPIKENFKEGVGSNELPFYNYSISFSSRNTFWKYMVIGKYNSNLKNTRIEGRENQYSFTGPEEITLKNGQQAYMFVSDSPLPLKQMYDFGFQLKSVKNGITNGKIIMENLPLASPELVHPESRDENSKIYSEIIVHI